MSGFVTADSIQVGDTFIWLGHPMHVADITPPSRGARPRRKSYRFHCQIDGRWISLSYYEDELVLVINRSPVKEGE